MPEDTSHHVATIPKNSREELRVRIGEYRGHTFADVRLFAATGEGERVPTGKGVTVAPDRVDALVEALQGARAEMVRRGLLAA